MDLVRSGEKMQSQEQDEHQHRGHTPQNETRPSAPGGARDADIVVLRTHSSIIHRSFGRVLNRWDGKLLQVDCISTHACQRKTRRRCRRRVVVTTRCYFFASSILETVSTCLPSTSLTAPTALTCTLSVQSVLWNALLVAFSAR